MGDDRITRQCTRCSEVAPLHSGVHQSVGNAIELRFVCGRCWTRILAERRGEPHEFHFRYDPIPRGVRAFELEDGRSGGHQFAVLAEDDEPNDAMITRLMEKMHRGLNRLHLKPGGIQDKTVRGRFEWDEEQDGRIPRVVVDGISLSWDELGEMLMSFEGWQFRLEIADPADEL